MPGLEQYHEEPGERRYDSQTQQQIIALATRLQSEHEETLTARQIQEIGAEVGIQPDFVRLAIAQLALTHPRRGALAAKQREFWQMLGALAAPLAWALLAFAAKDNPGAMTFFTLVAAPPLAVLTGFLSGRRPAGALAGIVLALSLAPSFSLPEFNSLGYAMFGMPLGMALGVAGASVREEYFPLAAEQPVSRTELLELLAALQRVG